MVEWQHNDPEMRAALLWFPTIKVYEIIMMRFLVAKRAISPLGEAVCSWKCRDKKFLDNTFVQQSSEMFAAGSGADFLRRIAVPAMPSAFRRQHPLPV
ncbi:hypothetical protein [Rhizobium sp. ICMP 5592]|uniref:hypothetical protein n=1 Tax=Rhizobium sp. ICMP 5592 TaxID=2292445 RepID=UPI0012948D31|nr:hypothetical protein [Rhizobium sp. ICMP 5592]MQB40885.1 hypothetical protein [Rhizobium sp. ICMP 5592]